ncbi:RteC domain-containing protein [uncultured Algibacter sp.]|uniref:RteC domain-containing protein n=1 Tax=uncultured Algibacter sp. TaxID=298659 RepID=UPI0026301AEF|nr:RteC domain-containing protein [uncultured Algibacter sp.]
MLYEELLKSFNEKLKDIHLRISSPMEEANQVIALCTLSLAKFQRAVENNGFKDMDMEINFFKSVKVIPMQYLIYYSELRSCELSIPSGSSNMQIQFLEKREQEVNSFFHQHKEFLVYIKQGHTLLDKYYYSRKYIDKIQPIQTYPYYKDPNFNTSHDVLLARIRGFELFEKFIYQRKLKIERRMNDFIDKEIIWTGTYAGFIEFVYGCQAMGYFNNGNKETIKIVEALGQFLGIEGGNPSRTYNEIKFRKNSRIKFFEETGLRLLQKMEDEDEKIND